MEKVPQKIVMSLLFLALALISCGFQISTSNPKVLPNSVELKRLNSALGRLKLASTKSERTEAFREILQLDVSSPSLRLSKHADDSVAMLCHWHELARSVDADLPTTERERKFHHIGASFGEFIQSRLHIQPPQEWLDIIADAYETPQFGILFPVEKHVHVFNSHVKNTCFPVATYEVAPRPSGRWPLIIKSGDKKNAGFDAEIVLPYSIEVLIHNWVERDSSNWISAIANETHVFLVIPTREAFSITQVIICRNNAPDDNEHREIWRVNAGNPLGGEASSSGRFINISQVRMDDSRLYLFSCYGHSIGVEVLDLESGKQESLFCSLPRTVMEPDAFPNGVQYVSSNRFD